MRKRMNNILEELFVAVYRFHSCTPKFQTKSSLTDVEFYFLVLIAATTKQKNNIVVGDLVDLTGASKSAISKKLTVLEQKGLIRRTSSVQDRRQIYVELTQQGCQMFQAEQKAKQQNIEQVIEKVGQEDMKQFIQLFNKVLDAMEDIQKEERN